MFSTIIINMEMIMAYQETTLITFSFRMYLMYDTF